LLSFYHSVNECHGSKLHNDGLQRLLSAKDVVKIVINWLPGTAVKELVKYNYSQTRLSG